eukprot:3916045-Prymnesium_polylepis.2
MSCSLRAAERITLGVRSQDNELNEHAAGMSMVMTRGNGRGPPARRLRSGHGLSPPAVVEGGA